MKRTLFASLALSGLLMIGCDEAKDAATKATDAAKDTVKTTTDATKDAVKSTTDATKNATDAAKDKVSGAVDATKDATKAVTDKAAGAVDAAKEAVTKQATDLYDKAMAAVKENKITDAEGILKTLEGLKDKLPAEWADKISSLKSAIDKAKALLPK